jgi:hypothetical protein
MNEKKKIELVGVKARYAKTGIDRYDGNPLIEALPTLPQRRIDFNFFVEHMPPRGYA